MLNFVVARRGGVWGWWATIGGLGGWPSRGLEMEREEKGGKLDRERGLGRGEEGETGGRCAGLLFCDVLFLRGELDLLLLYLWRSRVSSSSDSSSSSIGENMN